MRYRSVNLVGAVGAMIMASVVCVGRGESASNVLRAQIVGLRSSRGTVHCTLFNSDAFPDDDSKALKDIAVPIKDKSAECDFPDLAPGQYAITTFHDENGNGEFDTNLLGIPKEGFAFSNNVRPRWSKPKWRQCRFDYPGGERTVTIKMIYW